MLHLPLPSPSPHPSPLPSHHPLPLSSLRCHCAIHRCCHRCIAVAPSIAIIAVITIHCSIYCRCCHAIYCRRVAVAPSVNVVTFVLLSHRPLQSITITIALLSCRHIAIVAAAIAVAIVATTTAHFLLMVGYCIVVRRPLCHCMLSCDCRCSCCQPLLLPIAIHRRHRCHHCSCCCHWAATTPPPLPPPAPSQWSNSPSYIDKERGSNSTTTSVPTAVPP